MNGSRFTTGSRWKAVAVVAAALLAGSLVPVPFGRRPAFARFGPDKFLHLLGHGCFAAVTADALGASRRDPRHASALAVPVSIGYALVLGRLQERVPGREPELADLVASLLGSVLGATGWYLALSDGPTRRAVRWSWMGRVAGAVRPETGSRGDEE